MCNSIQTAPKAAENIGEVQISLTAQMKPQSAFQQPIHNQKRLALFSLVCFPSFSDPPHGPGVWGWGWIYTVTEDSSVGVKRYPE